MKVKRFPPEDSDVGELFTFIPTDHEEKRETSEKSSNNNLEGL